ncbi:MAG: riboflavin synthase [Baekduia sp.]
MFTGLVEAVGTVRSAERGEGGAVIVVQAPFSGEVENGDSVAVDGACLTVVAHDADTMRFDVMNESLRRTTLGALEPGAPVNLERAMQAGDRLGGHVVSGHVDGVGEVESVEDDGFARRLTVSIPADLIAHVVPQGSITIAGVSLTVAALGERTVTVSLIPETRERTTLGDVGARVNLETDVLAKHVARLVAATLPAQVDAALSARLDQIGDQ